MGGGGGGSVLPLSFLASPVPAHSPAPAASPCAAQPDCAVPQAAATPGGVRSHDITLYNALFM